MSQATQAVESLEIAEQVYLIPVDRIEPDPEQPREDIDFDEFDALVGSVRQNGLIQPIQVVPHPNKPGYWMIEFGERRWLAHKELDLETIKATIADRDRPDFVSQVVENLFRSNLNHIEEALALKRLRDGEGNEDGKKRTLEEVAEIAQVSVPVVYQRLHLLKLPPEIQRLIREKKLPSRAALKLRQFQDIPDAKLIELAHGLIEGSVSVTMLNELRGGKSLKGRKRGKSRAPKDPSAQLKRIINLRQRIPSTLPVIDSFISLPRDQQSLAFSALPEPARQNLIEQLPVLADQLQKLVSVLKDLPIVKVNLEHRKMLRNLTNEEEGQGETEKKRSEVGSIEEVRGKGAPLRKSSIPELLKGMLLPEICVDTLTLWHEHGADEEKVLSALRALRTRWEDRGTSTVKKLVQDIKDTHGVESFNELITLMFRSLKDKDGELNLNRL